MKRLFDILLSSFILIVFLPFGIAIAVWIALDSKGGVFFVQQRIGKNGHPFGLYKFRTMRPESEKHGSLTVGMKDPRITWIGQKLRKVKLDEFPQFINVLKGDMSIVGPRPEVKEFVDLYTSDQRAILNVKPGITDYASLEYFKENELLAAADDPRKTYIEDIMPAKIELNKKYLSEVSLSTDIKIMWATFKKMIA